MDIIKFVREIGVSKTRSKSNDDLFTDRLNHQYTVVIIVIFCAIVTVTQYAGEPIQCWVPGHFNGNYEKYTNRICWVSNTYNIPLNQDLPPSDTDRKVKMLKYYQWTPFILLFQALLFYLPRMIWRSLNNKSGLDLQSLVEVVHNYDRKGTAPPEPKKNTLFEYLANKFDQYLNTAKNSRLDIEMPDYEYEAVSNTEKPTRCSTHSEPINKDRFHYGKLFCITKGKRYGNYLLVLFVFVKVLFCVNSIVQLFILNHFLGNNFLVLGWEVLVKIWTGEDWTQLSRFPRVTMCDFSIREVGIVHRYTVQCVLSINLFNEKIFIFIWYWLFIVSLFNIFDLASWLYTLKLNSSNRYTYIRQKLSSVRSSYNQYLKDKESNERKVLKSFVDDYLQEDGVLALRLLSRNVHDLIVSQVVSHLYNSFRAQNKNIQGQNQSSTQTDTQKDPASVATQNETALPKSERK